MALAREMHVPFLGQIPIDREVVTAGDAGLTHMQDGPQYFEMTTDKRCCRSAIKRSLISQECSHLSLLGACHHRPNVHWPSDL